MRVAIDAILMEGDAARGMARFAQAFASHAAHPLVPLVPPAGHPRLARVLRKLLPLWEQVFLAWQVWRQRFDVLVCPSNTAPLFLPRRTRLVLVVHDTIFLHEGFWQQGNLTQRIGRLYRKLVVPRAVRRAHEVLTVSEYSCETIVERFGVSREKITILYNSLPAAFEALPLAPSAISTIAARKPLSIFSVAGDGVSKNLLGLLEAFALARQDLPQATLAVAGVPARARDFFIGRCAALGISDSVEILGRLTDQELIGHYRQCEIYVCASLMEGFGIPLIEAMACGCALAVSSQTAPPEICGGAARYFDPRNTAEMASVISGLLCDAEGREHLRVEAAKQAGRFTAAQFAVRCSAFWDRL